MKTGYRTKQKEVVLDYLKRLNGEHITAQDLCDCLTESGIKVGKATVYRQLERLVEEGLVYKYIVEAGTPACFEYVPEDSHDHHEVCFHCKCEKCGRLFHMHSDELEELTEELKANHRFAMDPRRTVFYGICDDCENDQRNEVGK